MLRTRESGAMQPTFSKLSTEFRLKPGERITASSSLGAVCDRMLEELAQCHYCSDPVYRVLTIITSQGLERRASLCEQHFVKAASGYPELNVLSA